MKDIYTKSVLTVIAVCLCVLVAMNARQFVIEDAYAGQCLSFDETKQAVHEVVNYCMTVEGGGYLLC